jgi:ABC-type antimicrobial peptide transport system permease subunit
MKIMLLTSINWFSTLVSLGVTSAIFIITGFIGYLTLKKTNMLEEIKS